MGSALAGDVAVTALGGDTILPPSSSGSPLAVVVALTVPAGYGHENGNIQNRFHLLWSPHRGVKVVQNKGWADGHSTRYEAADEEIPRQGMDRQRGDGRGFGNPGVQDIPRVERLGDSGLFLFTEVKQVVIFCR